MNKPQDINSFYQTVWTICKQVPSGKVTTYGQIASMIPPRDGFDPEEYKKLCPRWVGEAMNRVSPIDDGTIPWWRVINSKGGISLPGKAGRTQRERLEAEDIPFDDNGLVDLETYGWDGGDPDWRKEHGLTDPITFQSDAPKQLPLF
jgi:methylated-DNA-protein-cysteine methyltransferase-like protein